MKRTIIREKDTIRVYSESLRGGTSVQSSSKVEAQVAFEILLAMKKVVDLGEDVEVRVLEDGESTGIFVNAGEFNFS